jgi:hypothetical protein
LNLTDIEAIFWKHSVNCDKCTDKALAVLLHIRETGELSYRDMEEALEEYKEGKKDWNSKRK